MINVKRVYEKPEKSDGMRILVDRLWPRGLSKSNAKIDLWLKEIAPSNELRKWIHANPIEWESFKLKYQNELRNKSDLINSLKNLEKEKSTLTFLFASINSEQNNAITLKQILSKL